MKHPVWGKIGAQALSYFGAWNLTFRVWVYWICGELVLLGTALESIRDGRSGQWIYVF